MIDHFSLHVSDLQKSKEFYTRLLAPLGYQPLMEFPQAIGFGQAPKPSFWIAVHDPSQPSSKLHFAFTAKNRAAVDAFYQAALAAGAQDNGTPGLRAHYHPNYYGAFVIGPDGHNIEAVCHTHE